MILILLQYAVNLLKFDDNSFQSNIKTKSTLLKLATKHLVCCMCVRRGQYMLVQCPLKDYNILKYLNFVYN